MAYSYDVPCLQVCSEATAAMFTSIDGVEIADTPSKSHTHTHKVIKYPPFLLSPSHIHPHTYIEQQGRHDDTPLSQPYTNTVSYFTLRSPS